MKIRPVGAFQKQCKLTYSFTTNSMDLISYITHNLQSTTSQTGNVDGLNTRQTPSIAFFKRFLDRAS